MESKAVIIAGNWKMYKTNIEAAEYIKKLKAKGVGDKTRVLLAVPFTAISTAAEEAKGSHIEIGAQNMNDASEGAFTGEVAAKMLLDAGASFVILGHSERRRYFKEDNAFIHRKVQRAVREGLKAILCVGESYDEREAGKSAEVIHKQLSECLEGLQEGDISRLLIAYEPLWAIGTGVNATPSLVEEEHQKIRKMLTEKFGEEAGKIPLLYGGSVNPSNTSAYIEEADVDGLLVGGASLNLDTFDQIINYSTNKV
jgi:triosephosphate isomerase (TIM)